MNQPKKIRYWWGILPIAVFLVAWEIAALRFAASLIGLS